MERNIMETFRPERVRRIKWANGAEVVSVHDYDALLALYEALRDRQRVKVVQGNIWRDQSE